MNNNDNYRNGNKKLKQSQSAIFYFVRENEGFHKPQLKINFS